MKNPFRCPSVYQKNAEHVDATSRLELVKAFSEEQCRAALEVKDLQKTVRIAIERRLRRLNIKK
jgi:N-acetylmuramic acid 6-phosphate (MurNAc-6-P) etherase